MSDRGPGTPGYWVDTFVVVAIGLVFAALLWDGWPFGAETAARGPAGPMTLGEALEAGCLTQDDLAELVEHRHVDFTCPAEATP